MKRIVRTTSDAIWDELQPDEMPVPNKDTWIDVAARFFHRWNFPNCMGALDGKHVQIKCPNRSGSKYYNYKGHFSLVLLALCDADYKFTFVDIGDYGHQADGSIFKRSIFGQAFMNGRLDVPPEKELPNYPQGGPCPHCIVADEAFPLRGDIMRPYPRGGHEHRLDYDKQIFNYRLCRARRIIENAFGILVQRWRIFDRRIHLQIDNAISVVKACVMLHNFLMEKRFTLQVRALETELNPDDVPFLTDEGAIVPLPRVGYHSQAEARRIREVYKAYFNSPEGAVTWQGTRIAP